MEQNRPSLNAKQQLYYNTQGFLSSAALIACQAHHHKRGQAGTRIQPMCRGVGDEVIIHEPACTQAGQRACPEFTCLPF